MRFNEDTLNAIYDKTDGKCHICGKKLAFCNYGKHGSKAAWHVEHSKPQVNGGTDHLNNLYPSCIRCNLEKGTKSTRSVRNRYGLKKAPLSKLKKQQVYNNNVINYAIAGGLFGMLNGKKGVIPGILIGASIGASLPEECIYE